MVSASSASSARLQTIRQGDRWIAFAVGLAAVAVVLSLRPILGIPRNDDFSYARTAESLARTGHVAYNGWGSPLMLPQAVIGAILIKLFGFSYSVLDWFGVFCAGMSAALLYVLSRLIGLGCKAGLLIVAVLVANPMFLGTASTFMTDIPSLLLLLLSLCALVSSLQIVRASEGISANLHLDNGRFWGSAALAALAGANRQLSWVVYLSALLPVFFALPSKKERLILVSGAAFVTAVAVAVSWWLAQQPFTVPTNIIGGLILIVGYIDVIFAIVYRFFFTFGLFLLPIVLISVNSRDFKKPLLWVALALVALPLCFPVSNSLGYFGKFYGAAPSGQYFTSYGVKIGYMTGGDSPAGNALVPESIVGFWIVAGVIALGISLYLMTDWCVIWKSEARARETTIAWTPEMTRLRLIATVFLISTLAQIIVSLPWFAQLHVFDRYFLFYLPEFAIFFLIQRAIRIQEQPVSQTGASALNGLAGTCLVAMGIFSYALVATYDNCGRAQASLYHRLLLRGVPRQQIDNGFEFDADTQVLIKGYINSRDMIPVSAYDPNAAARNIPSVTPWLFPVMDGRFILSSSPHPSLLFIVEDTPADSESYVSYLPPGRQTVYVLHVSE